MHVAVSQKSHTDAVGTVATMLLDKSKVKQL